MIKGYPKNKPGKKNEWNKPQKVDKTSKDEEQR